MKKYSCLIAVILILTFSMGDKKVSAAETNVYQSNGEVEFYGVYEEPTEEENPVVDPTLPSTNGQVNVPVNSGVTNGAKLPQTGDQSPISFFVIGGVILCWNGYLLYHRFQLKNKL
ncbi:hypothetical protein CKN82_05680 [Carnobacterium divergens]|uniref:LPXTG cell wall anchor domain-containing protein n=1 Tax=Carnobacterium divergens TaxID=2748 RepID=UPI001071DB76|nr:LPXTG cell wall anchor domain-containing protein [Carnobacterium divergens]MDT1996697.1 LPXTG cell wall anchor domain-containing protein [Carnobacterium divergens]TFI65931.1 hypothetical protein CKN76_06125 [Carnobacterium divergens]TFI65981.1 hypothetical protein CKN59_06110 [Carnobacterium divergens]TFI69522.1 hypothetical protein CKN70_05730 [Carnobacterium divergens]TFI80814.1 hypothetical protein CKN74_06090 [Carnobacterium divergens]